ncbi:MAG: acyltransferase [Chloroflexi bacterium]|nr:acyltransferase [Chloroflexota bacterium]
MTTSSFSRKLYFSRFGQWFSRHLNPVQRWLKQPRMLWGYQDASGTWRVRTRISDTVFLYHPEQIFIEEDVFVWHYTILDGTGGLEIGRGSQIGAWVGVFTHSSHVAIRLYGHHYQAVHEAEKVAFSIEPIKIGRFVFIAAGAKILPGVTIGDGALIAAGSVVNKNVEPFQIVAGNPANVVGDTRNTDDRYLQTHPQLRGWYEEWQR